MEGQTRPAVIVAPLAGAWIETEYGKRLVLFDHVAPLAGAWIETSGSRYQLGQLRVAPLAGAWIETPSQHSGAPPPAVAPLAGAWIETLRTARKVCTTTSHPLRVRGLKHHHAVRGYLQRVVAPLAGAWIETPAL